jgi:Putative transposase/Transposase zinc-binding domain
MSQCKTTPSKTKPPEPYQARNPEASALFQTIQTHFETWLALASSGQFDGQGDHHTPPRFVEQAFRKYLECGVFAHGFARARCGDCGHDFLVAFSCKGRGVCPSCCTRRMNETAAHLVEHVFPVQPVRQWVLSVPKRLRYFMQRDATALNCALRLFLRAIRSALIERSKTIEGFSDEEINELQIGAVAFIHRFGSTLNEHIHFHICAVDGVFKPTNQGMQFFAAKPFSADFITQVQQTVRRRSLRAFVKRGYIDSGDAKTMQSYPHGGGFSVDASVRIAQHDRQGLERLLRYCARPPFAGQRIRIEGEQIIYRCPKAPAGEQGDTSVGGKRAHEIVLTPLEFIRQ